jgi:ribosome-binding protein aMBF1 (putative translation factor)
VDGEDEQGEKVSSERETITCPNPKCELVQFRTKADLCRRCKESTAPPEPQASVLEVNPEPAVFPEGTAEELARSVQLVISSRRGSMSQRQFAQKMDCQRTYISKIENAKAMPDLRNLERFARAFGIPLWLLVMEIELMRAMLTEARKEQEK